VNELEAIGMLFQLKQSIGTALTEEQQIFVSQNYPNILNFTNSDAGKKAISEFVQTWSKANKQ